MDSAQVIPAPSVSSSPKRGKNSKKVIFFIVISLLLVPMVIYLLQESKNNNTAIAEHTLQWIDTQKEPSGKYYFGISCTGQNACEKPQVDNRSGLYAMWGRFKYYERTKDANSLAQVKKDIGVYADTKIVPTIQVDHWSCKLLFDLWESDAFNSQEKQSIESICNRAQNYPLDNLQSALSLSDQDITALLSKLMNGTITSSSTPSQIHKLEFVDYATAASDSVTRFQWMKNEVNYKIALGYMRSALTSYAEKQDDISDYLPLLGIAAADMYQANHNNTYLQAAEYVYAKSAISPCESLELCMNTAFLAQELYTETLDNKYLTYKNETVSSLKNHAFDSPMFLGYRFGQQAFYLKYTNNIYPVQENGLMVGLLME